MSNFLLRLGSFLSVPSGLFLEVLAYVGVLASVASMAGYQGYTMGADAMIARQAKEDTMVRAVQDAALRGAAEAIAANRPMYKTIVQKVRHEIEKNTVYRDCKHSDEQLRNINAAITGHSSSQPAGSSKLPSTK